MTALPIAEPLSVATAKALRAHHALGCLATCSSAAEFADRAKELIALTRAVSQAIARIREESELHVSRRAFSEWLGVQLGHLQRHPFETVASPPVYAARLARGSGPPPFDGVAIGRVPTAPQRPEDFFFEGFDKRPALELCAEYLERVTRVLDETREQMRRLGYGEPAL
jgi:hypothetical protein